MDANSNITVEDASDYFEARLNSSAWDTATEDNQKASVVFATSVIDVAYDWVGYKATQAQALRWPRTGVFDPDSFAVESDEIPQFLADATAEMALALLENDRLEEDGTLGFSQIKVGPIFLQISRGDRRGVVPDTVESMLSFYGVKQRRAARTLERG